MSTLQKTLEITTSPHIHSGTGTDIIMRNVVYALLPVSAFAVYVFGLSALLVLLTAVLSCVLTEYAINKLNNKPLSVNDWSVTITGLLYGLTLPPALPLWMVFCGGVIGVGVGKMLFGGLGYNVFNPALVGRAVLQAAFPVALTTWIPSFAADRFTTLASSTLTFPFTEAVLPTGTGATPLAAMKWSGLSTQTSDLLFGLTSGSTGETSSALIIAGGIYLASRKMLNWRIPVAILASVFLLSTLFNIIDPSKYPDGIFMLFSGGLMLGAVFMATDMVASPITPIGTYLYGILIGLLVFIIRIWGGLPEGVMYAILFANAASPHIDRLIQLRVYGTKVSGNGR